MSKIEIESTRLTPYTLVDTTSGIIEIRGRSSPQNAREFYGPIENNLASFENSTDEITANFCFEYFNTSSAKCIFNIVKHLSGLNASGKKVTVNWYYEEEDFDMKETGEDMEDLFAIPFTYHEVPDVA